MMKVNSLFKKLRLAYLEDMINDPEVISSINKYSWDGPVDIGDQAINALSSYVGETFRMIAFPPQGTDSFGRIIDNPEPRKGSSPIVWMANYYNGSGYMPIPRRVDENNRFSIDLDAKVIKFETLKRWTGYKWEYIPGMER